MPLTRVPPPPPADAPPAAAPPADAADSAPRWFLESIAYLSGQISTVDTVARQAVASLAEQGHAIRQLQAEVFGPSVVPPPFSSHAPSAPTSPPPGFLVAPTVFQGRKPLAKRVTLSEDTTDSLTRELANLRAAFRAELSRQSCAMGLPQVEAGAEPPSTGKKARAYLFSRQGVKDGIALMTLVAAAAATLAGVRQGVATLPPAAVVAPPPQSR